MVSHFPAINLADKVYLRPNDLQTQARLNYLTKCEKTLSPGRAEG